MQTFLDIFIICLVGLSLTGYKFYEKCTDRDLLLTPSCLRLFSDCEPPRSALPRLPSSHKTTIDESRQTLSCGLARRDPGDVVAERLHESYCRVVVRIFEADSVGLKLIVQSGRHTR